MQNYRFLFEKLSLTKENEDGEIGCFLNEYYLNLRQERRGYREREIERAKKVDRKLLIQEIKKTVRLKKFGSYTTKKLKVSSQSAYWEYCSSTFPDPPFLMLRWKKAFPYN